MSETLTRLPELFSKGMVQCVLVVSWHNPDCWKRFLKTELRMQEKAAFSPNVTGILADLRPEKDFTLHLAMPFIH